MNTGRKIFDFLNVTDIERKRESDNGTLNCVSNYQVACDETMKKVCFSKAVICL